MEAQKSDLTVSNISIKIDDMDIPVMEASREFALNFFKYRSKCEEIISSCQGSSPGDPKYATLMKVRKELKQRNRHVQMSFYYTCEISGERRLLSSMCLFEDKIVTNKVSRSIQKEHLKEERRKEKKLQKEQEKENKRIQKELQKEEKKQQRKNKAMEEQEIRKQQLIQRRKEERGLTPLQIKVRRGEISREEYYELHKDKITPEEVDMMTEEYYRYLDTGMNHEDAKRFAEHFALYKRYLKKLAIVETSKIMGSDRMKAAIEMVGRAATIS